MSELASENALSFGVLGRVADRVISCERGEQLGDLFRGGNTAVGVSR